MRCLAGLCLGIGSLLLSACGGEPFAKSSSAPQANAGNTRSTLESGSSAVVDNDTASS